MAAIFSHLSNLILKNSYLLHRHLIFGLMVSKEALKSWRNTS